MHAPTLLLCSVLGACALHGCGHTSSSADCQTLPLGVQVLGSGGPIADDARASSGYVVWQDGHARLLVDVGGGVFARFGASGASVEDLDAILVSHLHADHVSDLPALLKSASFSSRAEPLILTGPSGSDRFPPMRDFVSATFDPEAGTFAYLGAYLQEGNPFVLDTREFDVERPEPVRVLENERMTVEAVGVPHGVVPTLGYVVTMGDQRIGFAADQRADDPRFAQMAEGVDLLVAHHAIGIDASPAARQLHATPTALGRLAAETGAGHLVLSHHMRRALEDREASEARVRARYGGPVTFAEDLQCVPVPHGGA